ncbi:MAG: sulfatase-like hydrolase/transferase [Armatimonadetes bacterium]|nr:sulfatase-like hydrolase/transferase [Armatimonadota bacterium]
MPKSDNVMKRPNILWLNCDHFAYVPHFALNRDLIRTPAFDRLCIGGTLFPNAYTVCPLCTPARASLATGQYPHRHGVLNNDGAHGSRQEFAPDAPLVARDLHAAGYHAALFGKWHAVGNGEATAGDAGYQGWSPPRYGSVYNRPAYADYLEEMGLEHPDIEIEWHLKDASQIRRRPLHETASDVAFHQTCGVIQGPKETHESYFLAHGANRYLEKRAQDGAPFCLRVDPWGPHQPYYVAPPFAGSVDPQKIAPPPNFAQDYSDRPAHQKRCLDEILKGATTRTWPQWAPVVAR